MSNGTPNVGVAVFVRRLRYAIPERDNDQYLLMLRKNKEGFGDGEWALPGGKVDWMENPVDAARRECMEEVGFIPTNLEFLGYTNDVWPELGKHFITLYYKAVGEENFTNIEPTKCEDIQWVSIDAFTRYKLFSGIAQMKRVHYLKLCRSNQE